MSEIYYNWLTHNKYDISSLIISINNINQTNEIFEKGYLYIYSNKYFDTLNVYKFGKSLNYIDKTLKYMSENPERGFYVKIIEVNLNIINELEIKLINYFTKQKLHYFIDGMYLFNKEIENTIFHYLNVYDINHKIILNNENTLNEIKITNKKNKKKRNKKNKSDKIKEINNDFNKEFYDTLDVKEDDLKNYYDEMNEIINNINNQINEHKEEQNKITNIRKELELLNKDIESKNKI